MKLIQIFDEFDVVAERIEDESSICGILLDDKIGVECGGINCLSCPLTSKAFWPHETLKEVLHETLIIPGSGAGAAH